MSVPIRNDRDVPIYVMPYSSFGCIWCRACGAPHRTEEQPEVAE